MHETHLVRVHKARVAHHVAAVGQVDRQHRTTPVRHGRRAVIVQLIVVVRTNIAARENFFQMLEESRIDRHHIFEMTVNRAVLHHQNLAVALDNLRLDLTNFLVQQNLMRQLAVDNLLPNRRHTLGAKRVRRTRPAERRLFFLVALQQRLVAPLGRKALIRADVVQPAENLPAELRYAWTKPRSTYFAGFFAMCASPEFCVCAERIGTIVNVDLIVKRRFQDA